MAFSTIMLTLLFSFYLAPTLASVRLESMLLYSSLYNSLSNIYLRACTLNKPLYDENAFILRLCLYIIDILPIVSAFG